MMNNTFKKNNLFKIVFLMMLVLCGFLTLKNPTHNPGVIRVEAASSKKKALKAYKKILTKKKIKYTFYGYTSYSEWESNVKGSFKPKTFATAYINNDSIPELIVYSYAGNTDGSDDSMIVAGVIYTYTKGKAKVVGLLWDRNYCCYYKKKGVVNDGNRRRSYPEGGYYTRQSLRKWVNGLYRESIYKYDYLDDEDDFYIRAKGAVSAYNEDENIIAYASANGKGLTKAEYEAELKKMTGGVKATKFKWHKNNKKYRNKYLKTSKIGK